MKKIRTSLIVVISMITSAQLFARGTEAIYACNDSEIKMTLMRNRISLESNLLGLCIGHADIVGGTMTTHKVKGFLGAHTCNNGLTVEWEDPYGLGNALKRTIKLTSKSGSEMINCRLIQEGID